MLTPERVKTHWWRGALAVAAVVVACFAESPFAALFGLLPTLFWCLLAPSRRTGLIVGALLVALLAWFVLPLGLAGPWVPAPIELYWLHTTLAAVICAIGARRGFVRLFLLVVAGFVVTGGVWFLGLEAPPGAEGVLPGPAGLQNARHEECASGGCWWALNSTGADADRRWHEHLAAQGYSPAPAGPITGAPRFCRTTGIAVTHMICVELTTSSADAVHLEWYDNT
ncbi:hypothetical protein M8542_47415 [Amycolatopsis sp. OK19-0408]|uniref:Uncharacterized protein n=1 Tax=Amycolatopsis iheyensis TaxID=2945988 RepID=A0A9X2NNP1_9PSEU|nr:hypothetical protein [Amycolatopsis iheyensis]MCR6490460.1 hypothetical protein [Amycolatopsis iheyensis]